MVQPFSRGLGGNIKKGASCMTDKKKITDWERIEFDYRAGILSLREIAAAHDITEGAIRKRAKRDGWERDLGAKIRAKAESLVRKDVVRSEVRSSSAYQTTEKEVIEANAQLQANALLDHRKNIKRGRTLAMKLLVEVEAQTDDLDLFERLGELFVETNEGESPERLRRMQETFDRVLSTPSRIDGLKKLSDTMKNLIALERQALGLSADYLPPNEDDVITVIERRIIG